MAHHKTQGEYVVGVLAGGERHAGELLCAAMVGAAETETVLCLYRHALSAPTHGGSRRAPLPHGTVHPAHRPDASSGKP